MGKKCVAMLLAGGQGSRLGVLTKNMAKPAVPFGGKYRIIDFPLSNCSNSGIDVVGVLTQYQPLELNSYIGNGMPWDLDRLTGGAYVLPPYQKGKSGTWYKGTANAIYQNLAFIEQYDPDYVLVLSGDHIYKMDYSDMLAVHQKKNADCTIAVYSVPWNEASRFGIMNTNEDGDIIEFEEKPAEPKSNNASMGIYIFNWKDLKQYLIEDEANPESSNDFGKNIIPRMLGEGKHMVAYNFEGYWKDVGTIESLWEANMDLLETPPAFNLYDSSWRIYGRNPVLPPHYIAAGAEVSGSMVTEGCMVAGKVEHSILFSGAQVEEGAVVENSVIMNGAVICKGARIRRAIVSENAVVGPDSVVGGNGRIAVVGPETTLPEYSVVKPGEQVDTEVLAKRLAKAEEEAK
ncbi:MAG: glucose-1-phosphate adenylyltransferase [Candidatus Spyradocola sp.]